MGTYGDRGNALVLERRLAWRDLPGDVVEIAPGEPIPSTLDIYVLGGAEDVPQTLAVDAPWNDVARRSGLVSKE